MKRKQAEKEEKTPCAFAGKRVLVTGAGKGIGRQICVQLSQAGATVIAVSRTQSDLDSLAREIGSDHGMHTVDISDVSKIPALMKACGDVDMLVNNAGVGSNQHFLETTIETFDEIMSVNVRAVFALSQAVARNMVKRGCGGSIVNVSSQASMVALPLHTAYCTSKGALDQLTRMMALELGPYQIRVNSVNPTVVLTDLGKRAWTDPVKAAPMLARIPLGKFAEPEDVADTVLYLLSDAAAMVHGVMLPIDGGFLAGGLPGVGKIKLDVDPSEDKDSSKQTTKKEPTTKKGKTKKHRS